jgi:hypothetical protein
MSHTHLFAALRGSFVSRSPRAAPCAPFFSAAAAGRLPAAPRAPRAAAPCAPFFSAASLRAAPSGAPLRRQKPGPRDPLFKDVWRRFQLRVHPDLFTAYPKLQAANATSLQKLQGVLNESRTAERRPEDVLKPRTESLEFYLRPVGGAPPAGGAPPTFIRVPFTLRVPGARCQHSLAESLGTLFGYAGLPTVFHWGPEFFNSVVVKGPEVPEEKE